MLKLKKQPIDNISSLRQNNLFGGEEGLHNKGKSLGNKKVTNLVKDNKYAPITEKKVWKNNKTREDARKKKFVVEPDEYY